jgi:hypothetical protein
MGRTVQQSAICNLHPGPLPSNLLLADADRDTTRGESSVHDEDTGQRPRKDKACTAFDQRVGVNQVPRPKTPAARPLQLSGGGEGGKLLVQGWEGEFGEESIIDLPWLC